MSFCCYITLLFDFFFFSSRRRHTRYIGDWSSDVCSSDLACQDPQVPGARQAPGGARRGGHHGVDTRRSGGVRHGGVRRHRSEERRVGKECRYRWWACEEKKERVIGEEGEKVDTQG